jgi:hypothetical protein
MADAMLTAGFSDAEIRRMLVDNSRALAGHTDEALGASA